MELNDGAQKIGRKLGNIARGDEEAFTGGCLEARDDPHKRAFSGAFVGDRRQPEERITVAVIGADQNFVEEGGHLLDDRFKQRATVKRQQALVSPHARATAAGQDCG